MEMSVKIIWICVFSILITAILTVDYSQLQGDFEQEYGNSVGMEEISRGVNNKEEMNARSMKEDNAITFDNMELIETLNNDENTVNLVVKDDLDEVDLIQMLQN